MGCKNCCVDFVSQKVPKYEKTECMNYCIGCFKFLLYVIAISIIIRIAFTPKWHHQQLPVEGTSVVKVNGTLYSTSGDLEMDVQDYTMNQNMPDSFFIATQLNVTEQKRSKVCSNKGKKKWCTSPGTMTKQYSLTGIEDLTVLIKNWVMFMGGIKWSNINAFHNISGTRVCRYDPTDWQNKYCPVFEIGTILKAAGENSSFMEKGGVINIDFNWRCNAHESEIKKCKPTIKFKRVDNIKVTEKGGGVTFRQANYYGQDSRDLVKGTGIRFIIINTGYGYSFDFWKLVLKVGEMLGYTTAITFGAAFCMERTQYNQRKLETNTEHT